MSASPTTASRPARGCWTGAIAAIAVVVLAVPGLVAAADAPPDAARIDALAGPLSAARAVRVTGPFGTRVLRSVRLDTNGIVDARWGPGGGTRPALIASRDVMPPAQPAPIPWSEIARIETGRASTGRLAVIGLALGGLVGTVVWRTVPLGYDGARGEAALVVGVPTLTGLVVGAVLGSQQYRWRTVYASDRAPSP